MSKTPTGNDLVEWMAKASDERLKVFIPDGYDTAIVGSILGYIKGMNIGQSEYETFEDSFLRYLRSSTTVVTVKGFANAIEVYVENIAKERQADKDFKELVASTRKRMSEKQS